MSKTSLQTIGLFAALGCIVAAAPLLWRVGAIDESRAGLKLGEPMPELTGVEGWLNGEGPNSDDLKGEVVFVNAWFLGCPICHERTPDLVEIYNKYHDKGVVFVGMTFDDGEQVKNVQRFLDKYNVKWPNAYGARETLLSFEAEYFPGYWLIGRDGKVVWNKSLQGKVPIESAIDEALAAAVPTVPKAAEPDTESPDPATEESPATAQL
jgi:thiol-disulfide isomerase/thioredoxin